MGIKSMIRFCYVTLAVILISTNASAMISGEEDYQRADNLIKCILWEWFRSGSVIHIISGIKTGNGQVLFFIW